jgi:hypothetical protein
MQRARKTKILDLIAAFPTLTIMQSKRPASRVSSSDQEKERLKAMRNTKNPGAAGC